MNELLKNVNAVLIKSHEAQIKLCEDSIEFLHERENSVKADAGLPWNVRQSVLGSIQEKITGINTEIKNHFAAIRNLNWELKQ